MEKTDPPDETYYLQILSQIQILLGLGSVLASPIVEHEVPGSIPVSGVAAQSISDGNGKYLEETSLSDKRSRRYVRRRIESIHES